MDSYYGIVDDSCLNTVERVKRRAIMKEISERKDIERRAAFEKKERWLERGWVKSPEMAFRELYRVSRQHPIKGY